MKYITYQNRLYSISDMSELVLFWCNWNKSWVKCEVKKETLLEFGEIY